jgi:putative endonuclease
MLLAQIRFACSMESVPYQVYILRCGDGTYYTGQTKDLDKRILAHNRGAGARYTRGRGPVQLVYQVSLATLKEAFILEHKIKRLPRAGKEKLIAIAIDASRP